MPTELDLLEWIAALEQPRPRDLGLGIGDDCATFSLGQEGLAISQDLLVEDVHFRRSLISPRFLGRKALRVNLSDLAAVGALPYVCLLGLSIPRELSGEFFQKFFEGFLQETRHWNCPLVGGDLSNARTVQVSVTVVGRLPAGTEIGRSGAQAGDSILLVGQLGLSRRGLEDILSDESGDLTAIESEESLIAKVPDPGRFECLRAHWLPHPQIEAGAWLRQKGLANAMLDVSDGLATDLLRLATASGLQAVLEVELLREQGSTIGSEELDYLLNGGEDYALLVTADSSKLAELQRNYPQNLPPFAVVGKMEKGSPRVLLEDSGGRIECEPHGFDHFR